jgi:hypothetical protein
MSKLLGANDSVETVDEPAEIVMLPAVEKVFWTPIAETSDPCVSYVIEPLKGNGLPPVERVVPWNEYEIISARVGPADAPSSTRDNAMQAGDLMLDSRLE